MWHEYQKISDLAMRCGMNIGKYLVYALYRVPDNIHLSDPLRSDIAFIQTRQVISDEAEGRVRYYLGEAE